MMAESSSSDTFDPYLKWLGIRDPERPPNHYRLLGVELFETDLDVIASAADRQMAHVRRFQHGAHVDLSQQLLNQLATAKVCLLRASSKDEYDRALRESMDLAKVAAIADQHVRSTNATRAKRNRPSVGYYVGGIALAAFATALIVWRGQAPVNDSKQTASTATPTIEATDVPELPEASHPPEPPDKSDMSDMSDPSDEAAPPDSEPDDSGDDSIDALAPLRPPTTRPTLRRPGEEGRQAPDPRSFTPATRPTDATTPQQRNLGTAELDQEVLTFIGLDASDTSESPGTFGRLRMAMQSRDMAQADVLIKQLRQESSSYPQREAAERMWLIQFQLRQFWNAVQKGLTVLKPGIELTVGDKVVKVVEVKPGQIVFQAGDEPITMATDMRTMDRGLAMTLATIHYLRQGASPQPAVAAFLAVDKAGDPALASQIWHELRQRNMATPLPVKPSRRKSSS